MKVMRNVKFYNCFRNALTVVGLLILVASCALVALAQNSKPQKSMLSKMSFYELLKTPGKLLSEGNNSIPIGKLKVKTYRLEEISPMGVEDEKSQQNADDADRAFRLTVTGESIFNGTFIIWIGDAPLTNVIYNRKELTTIIFDPSVLENGADISVTRYSENEWESSRSTIPDLLQLPVKLQTQAGTSSKYFIKEIRNIPKALWLQGKHGVEIEIHSEDPFPVLNSIVFLQIGNLKLIGSVYKDDHTQVYRLSAEQFAQLKDNETVRLKYGNAPTPGIKVGRLDKSMLRAF